MKTMAVEINENTHPIAVACLPAGFAMLKKSEVFGTYLIINHLLTDWSLEADTNRWVSQTEEPPMDDADEDEDGTRVIRYSRVPRPYNRRYGQATSRLTLRNLWMSKQDFANEFKRSVGAPPKKNDTFFAVVPL